MNSARLRFQSESGLIVEAPIRQAALLRRLGSIAGERGTRVFLVGGPVRDLLLGLESPDIDLAVEKDSRGFGLAVARETGGRFVYHSRFLTGTVEFAGTTSSVPDGVNHIDICQTRVENYLKPAVLPTVKPSSIEDDLARRDFSINSMALELTAGRFGRFVDPHQGRADLASRVIRALHPRSFVDDPTRPFRAIRFAVRLEFRIEPATLKLMRDSIRQGFPALLTPERMLYELRLICAEAKVLQMFEALVRERLLASCFGAESVPSSSLLSGLHRLVKARVSHDMLYLFVLSRLPITERFPITRQEREAARAVKCFSAVRSRLLRAGLPSAVYRLLRTVPGPALDLLSCLEAAPVRRRIEEYARMCRIGVSATGRDLGRLGLAPGPKYRRILDRLLFARLDGRVSSDEEEMGLARALVKRALRNAEEDRGAV